MTPFFLTLMWPVVLGCVPQKIPYKKKSADTQPPKTSAGPSSGDTKPPQDPKPAPAPKPPPPTPVAPNGDAAQTLATARKFLGYRYWWGGARLEEGSPDKGWCKGACPNCSGAGQNGADCSGLVAKAWRLPPAMPLNKNLHPYSTRDLIKSEHTYWKAISRTALAPGDIAVYDTGGSGHTGVISAVNSTNWGKPQFVEAKGCSYGIIEGAKTLGSSYQIRRKK